jgi:hypothetical protein
LEKVHSGKPKDDMMKQRKTLAAILGIAAFGLTGCPMSLSSLEEDSYMGLPSGQRSGSGDQAPGALPAGGGGTGGGGSTGGGSGGIILPGTGGTFGDIGSNPSEVILASGTSLRVDALFPKSSLTRVAISNTNRGMLAVAGVKDLAAPTLQPSLSVTWPSVAALLSMGARDVAANDPALDAEDTFKQQLRKRLPTKTPLAVRGSLQPRALSTDSKVWILTGNGSVEQPIWVYNPQSVTVNGRTVRFAIAVDTDDRLATFGSLSNPTLVDQLNAAIAKNILPRLLSTSMYGSLPTPSEAAQEGITFVDDVVYFIFSSKLEPDLLGYFNPGDFFPGGGSNQIKALYLSADAARLAQNDREQRNDLLGTIAHEFQHLCFAWNRVKAVGSDGYLAEAHGGADVWIDEGLAMYATAATGFGLEAKAGEPLSAYVGPSRNVAGHLMWFLNDPEKYSLVAFHKNATLAGETGPGNPRPAYGMAYLFSQYMVDQVGEGIVSEIASSKKNGFTIGNLGLSGQHDALGIVNDALGRRGVKLNTLFANFSAAIALDGSDALAASEKSVRDRYDIQRLNLRKSPFTDLPFAGPATRNQVATPIRPFGVQVVSPGLINDPSSVQFSGNSSVTTRLILHR